jgi:two-component system alkaline phosphatase synthesis response regulator PhoP
LTISKGRDNLNNLILEKPMNILIVDDERLYCKLVKEYFEQEGWSVFMAENGQEGLAKLLNVKIDVVVSDIYIPIMNGV